MNFLKIASTVFVTGFSVMVLEITGSRVIAPYVGNSIFVWTSLIGIILASLSLGYYFGGNFADKNPKGKYLFFILILSSLYIGVLSAIKEPLLGSIQGYFFEERIASIIVALIFAPPTFLLGAVTPFSIKLSLKKLTNTGSVSGQLFAISTVGSIAGTFASGFFLLPILGNTNILQAISLLLFITSLLYIKRGKLNKQLIFALIGLGLLFFLFGNYIPIKGVILDKDTAYSRIILQKSVDSETGRPILNLKTNRGNVQSAIYLEGEDEIVHKYKKFYRLGDLINPNINRALAIGGAGYSYPKDFLKTHGEAEIDVVEIDPEMTKVAKKYFNLKENKRLNIYHKDARVFVEKNKENLTYDAVYMDAFLDGVSIPYQLTTVEFLRSVKKMLTEDGLIITNLIGTLDEKRNNFLHAQYKTYSEVFPSVYVFAIENPNEPENIQNMILVATKRDFDITKLENQVGAQFYLKQLYKGDMTSNAPIFTDDFSPVDQYVLSLYR